MVTLSPIYLELTEELLKLLVFKSSLHDFNNQVHVKHIF